MTLMYVGRVDMSSHSMDMSGCLGAHWRWYPLTTWHPSFLEATKHWIPLSGNAGIAWLQMERCNRRCVWCGMFCVCKYTYVMCIYTYVKMHVNMGAYMNNQHNIMHHDTNLFCFYLLTYSFASASSNCGHKKPIAATVPASEVPCMTTWPPPVFPHYRESSAWHYAWCPGRGAAYVCEAPPQQPYWKLSDQSHRAQQADWCLWIWSNWGVKQAKRKYLHHTPHLWRSTAIRYWHRHHAILVNIVLWCFSHLSFFHYNYINSYKNVVLRTFPSTRSGRCCPWG